MTAKHSFDSPERLGTKKMGRWCRCDRTMPTKQSTPKKMNFITAAKRDGYMKKGGGFNQTTAKARFECVQKISPPHEMIEQVQHVQYYKNKRPATCEATKNDM